MHGENQAGKVGWEERDLCGGLDCHGTWWGDSSHRSCRSSHQTRVSTTGQVGKNQFEREVEEKK